MEFVCGHCEKLATGSVYRVVSEEGGIVLLDMIVCYSCYVQAKTLGLDAKQIDLREFFPGLRTRRQSGV